MKNVFLLGDIYNEISEELYNEKLSRASRFEQQKQIYFDEIYKNNNSKVTIYNIYKKNILNWELILNKDLYEFDIAQLDELISSIPSSSIHIKASVYSFCNQYLNYCISKRIISMNNIKALPRDTYTEISQKLASSRLISYNQFWDMVQLMEIHTDIQNIIPIVMSYYCVNGDDMKWMRNLKLSDIDEETEVVYITSEGEIQAVIPVDKEFINYCKKACDEADMCSEYVSTSLIIKPTINSRSDIVPENTVYARIYVAFDSSNIKRIRLNDLAKSRKIGLLLDIRKQRKLNTLDFQGVCSIMRGGKCSRGIYNSLQKYYEQATKDVVLKANSKEEELLDINLEENYKKILNNLGWE